MSTTSATTVATDRRTSKLPVFRSNMAASWRSLLFWSLFLLAAVALLLPFHTTFTTPSMLAAVNRLPRVIYWTLRFDQIHTGPGYVQAMIFSGIGFLAMITAGIQWGSGAIAEAQEDGSLDAVIGRGVGPIQYCLEASAAVLTRLSIIALITYGAIRWMNKPLGVGLKIRLLGQTTIVWLGLGALVAAVAILVSAFIDKRIWAVAAGVAVTVSSYTVDAISRLNPNLHWIADLSPVDWAFGDNPLWKGLDGWGEVSLWLLSLILVACAARVFQWRGRIEALGEGE